MEKSRESRLMETAFNYITDMSIVPRFNPIYPENIFDIISWCRDYPKFDKFPVTTERRFGIALYQIHQCMDWKDNGVNKYESLAASVLHFIMVGETMNLDTTYRFTPDPIKRILYTALETSCYEILHKISAAQQQLYYGVSKTQRGKRRYNKNMLSKHISNLCYILIACIPVEFCSECFEKATTIICRELK